MAQQHGAEVELDVTNIAHGGVSVARLEGRVVFVADAIPGERVRARLADTRRAAFWRADTVAVLEPSPHRRPQVWDAAALERDPAERAGGAEFGHIELGHQRELKRRVLSDALARFAGIEADVAVEAVPAESPDGTGWRTRVRLHVDAAGRLGPVAARSHRVVPVASLPLATAGIRAAAPLGERFPGERRVDLVAPSTGGVRLVVGRQRPGPIVERVGEREFRLADTGFWQVHRGAAALLTAAVQQAIGTGGFAPDAANLDLYGGVGLFAAAVAERFGSDTRITSVEADAGATGFAAANLAEWPGARAETGRVEHWIARLAAGADARERSRLAAGTVVLDPPRAGAGRDVVRRLAGLAPARIVYVACDPVALARDLGEFARLGYRAQRIRAFDLFPNTHHLETVVALVPDMAD
ncbi:MAG: class I SAM-dependent RNA methyltransferase [Microbacteriaceae bacterium]